MTHLHILHVDPDSTLSAHIPSATLQNEVDIEVITEQRAADAIQRLQTLDEQIDCIVSEYELPETDGLEFLERVRAEYAELPFILFTGSGSESVASEAISAGATDYVQKTAGEKQATLLLNRITNVVEQYHSRRDRDRVYQALETATEGIGILAEDNRYLYVNDAYADLYGYEQDDLIGTHWEELYPDDEAQRFHDEILPELERAGTWAGRSHGQRVTGERFPEELSLTQLDTGGHVCVVRDISQRLQRERQFETLASNLQGLVFRAENNPEWALEHVMGNVEDFIGYSATELESHEISWREIIHPDDRETVWDSVQTALEDGDKYEITYRLRDREGTTKWVIERGRGVTNSDGSIEYLEGLITDITERKRREQELEWKTKAMDEAPMGIIISNPSQDEMPITYVNNHFCEVTGYDEDDAIGRNPRFLQGPLTADDPVEKVRDAIESRTTVETDILNYRSDGTPFWNHMQIAPITDSGGDLAYFVGFQNDVTDRVESERRIEVLHRILLHNIRNELNILLGHLTELKEQQDVDPDTISGVKQPATNLLASSEKARQIEALLTSTSFEPEPVSLSTVFDRVLNQLSVSAEDVDLQLEGLSDRTVVAQEQIAAAFRELLQNAVKHSSKADQTATVTAEQESVVFSEKGIERDAIKVHVEDSNPLISELDRTRLLGDKESPVHHGSGLGLWLVNWLVTMSGGLVSYTERESGGNRVTVVLLQSGEE
ncbi:PAS domain S-box protein [Natronorubrum sp. JWXQ-INN-674]|uniref:PAS domain S-box protein n=1 Tax=Natronorubrum halalkaliphilum TaxID=2691917 RepID=A0A6B0VKT2_9EURY|nr:PAS domain S-box protein [Natronorubrum halalkaliphilum]MXV61616.1 PAS domain S-box protein [Natronorubrum halalkaliphilum]